MNNFKLITVTFIVFVIFLSINSKVLADTLPLSNINVLLKSLTNGRVISINTDTNGNFSSQVPELDGAYNVFINDESIPPVKITANKNTLSGRIVILTNGSTTKDPVVKKKTIKAKK